MTTNTIIGWDVGGAHLKAAELDVQGAVIRAVQLPCPLWQGLHHLENAVDQILAGRKVSLHALTMTGELVDLFANRQTGVSEIIKTMSRKTAGATLHVYAGAKGFVSPEHCKEEYEHIASMNWHATGMFAASCVEQGLLIDVGSTTTDLMLLRDGRVHCQVADDYRRMVADELVYTGVVRTPLMALAQKILFEEEQSGVMAEYFATTADIYRITGELPKDADQLPAADNSEKTVAASVRRLARMIGRDADSASASEWHGLASQFAEIQLQQLRIACERQLATGLIDSRAPLIGAGAGSFLVQKLAQRLGRNYIDFSTFVNGDVDTLMWVQTCAPAYAVAALVWAQQRDTMQGKPTYVGA
jgi:(4-(4-[2-(gamma-L-glutamylamino)ethyl]phenoxymethyl)furan-2-yl)methanamine synthase